MRPGSKGTAPACSVCTVVWMQCKEFVGIVYVTRKLWLHFYHYIIYSRGFQAVFSMHKLCTWLHTIHADFSCDLVVFVVFNYFSFLYYLFVLCFFSFLRARGLDFMWKYFIQYQYMLYYLRTHLFGLFIKTIDQSNLFNQSEVNLMGCLAVLFALNEQELEK